MSTVTRYGPHDESTAPALVTVLRPVRQGGAHDVPVHPAITRQRAQLNDLAHLGYVKAEHTGRVPDAPYCLVCMRGERDCLAVRFGDDDHPFEPSWAVAT